MMDATSEMVRSENSKNIYQGAWPRVLCVCSAGLLRSPTLAWVLSNPPYNCNTRAAGSHREFALVPVDQVLLDWAQRVVFVNRDNYLHVLKSGLELSGCEVYVLNLPDQYQFRQPELVMSIEADLIVAGFPHFPIC